MAAGVAQTMIQRRETKLHRLLLLIIMINSFVARVITLLLNSPSARHNAQRVQQAHNCWRSKETARTRNW
jgi:hypothetical protein